MSKATAKFPPKSLKEDTVSIPYTVLCYLVNLQLWCLVITTHNSIYGKKTHRYGVTENVPQWDFYRNYSTCMSDKIVVQTQQL